jgi:hypothetical protein
MTRKPRQMRLYCFALAIILLVAPSAHSKELDFSTITCSAFWQLGQANMAAVMVWLLSYHSGKTGIIPFQETDSFGSYAWRLGAYCKQHPDRKLVEASQEILSVIDHGT